MSHFVLEPGSIERGTQNTMDKIPLNYEASEGDTHKRQTSTLPTEVVQCLENARFVWPPVATIDT